MTRPSGNASRRALRLINRIYDEGFADGYAQGKKEGLALASARINDLLVDSRSASEATQPNESEHDNMPIESLTLSNRAYNAIKQDGIHTVGELASRTADQLLDIRNFGSTSLSEVRAALKSAGRSLSSDRESWTKYYDDDDEK